MVLSTRKGIFFSLVQMLHLAVNRQTVIKDGIRLSNYKGGSKIEAKRMGCTVHVVGVLSEGVLIFWFVLYTMNMNMRQGDSMITLISNNKYDTKK